MKIAQKFTAIALAHRRLRSGNAGAQQKVLKVAPHAFSRQSRPVQRDGGYITRNHGYMVYDTLFATG